MSDDELERLAAEELLKEAKRGAERAKEMGSLGWQKTPVPPANKVFLKNMLMSTIRGSSRDRKRKRSGDSHEYPRSTRKEKYARKDKHYKDYDHHKNSDYKKDHGQHREKNDSPPAVKTKKKSKKSHRKKSSTKHKRKKHRKSKR